MPNAEERAPIGEIVDNLEAATDRDCVRLGALVAQVGDRSFLPVLMVPALLVVSPLSGIPLFSTACGLTIAFVAAQMVAGRRHLWLPGLLMRLRIDGKRARAALSRVHRLAHWLDAHSRARLRPLLRAPVRKVAELLCMLCGLAMPFLEIVPLSSSLLGVAVLFFATALMVRDGMFALAGLAAMALAAAVPALVLSAA